MEIYDKNEVLLTGYISGDIVRSTNGVGYRTMLHTGFKKFPLFIPAETYLKFPAGKGAFVDVMGAITRAKNGHNIYVLELKPAKLHAHCKNQATIEGRVVKNVEIGRENKPHGIVHTAHIQIKNKPEISNTVTVRVSSLVDDTPVVTFLKPEEEIVVKGKVLPTVTNHSSYLYMFGNSIKRK